VPHEVGSPPRIAGLRKTIGDAGASGRFWIGLTTGIHPADRLENVLAMWDEIEKDGYYE